MHTPFYTKPIFVLCFISFFMIYFNDVTLLFHYPFLWSWYKTVSSFLVNKLLYVLLLLSYYLWKTQSQNMRQMAKLFFSLSISQSWIEYITFLYVIELYFIFFRFYRKIKDISFYKVEYISSSTKGLRTSSTLFSVWRIINIFLLIPKKCNTQTRLIHFLPFAFCFSFFRSNEIRPFVAIKCAHIVFQ